MRCKCIFLLSVIFLITSCQPHLLQTKLSNTSHDLVIENVQIFDSISKQIIKNRSVVIDGDTITKISSFKDKHNALKTIDGKGNLLTPGFIDTHNHFMLQLVESEEEPLPELNDESRDQISEQFLPWGTTTLVDMGQPDQWLDISSRWQSENSFTHSDFIIAGSSLISNNDRRNPPHHQMIGSQEDLEKRLDRYKQLGIKHLKLYRKLNKDDMSTVVKAAQSRNIHVYAHTDNSVVTIFEALALGVRDFEHFFTVIPSVLPFRDEIPNAWKILNIDDIRNDDEFAATMVAFFEYVRVTPEYDTKLKELFEEMAANNATISTTINILGSAAGKARSYSSFEPSDRDKANLPYNQKQQQTLADAFDTMMNYLKQAHDVGVKIRIGTDTKNGGEALLSEMLLLSQAGFTMPDVLQIATLNGAEALNIDDNYGSIEVGKKADLILFTQNPVVNSDNIFTKKIIIKNGVEFGKQ